MTYEAMIPFSVFPCREDHSPVMATNSTAQHNDSLQGDVAAVLLSSNIIPHVPGDGLGLLRRILLLFPLRGYVPQMGSGSDQSAPPAIRSPFLTISGICSVVGLMLIYTLIVHWLLGSWKSYTRGKEIAIFASDHMCVPTQRALPRRFLSSIRNKLDLLSHKGGDLLDDVFARKYQEYGETHALYDSYGVAKVVHTIDPVNVQALLSSKAQDYRGPRNRKGILYPLAQDGILTTEGAEWSHHRKTIQRLGFRGAKDCRNVEPDVQLLFDAIGYTRDCEGWTPEVDLLDLFIRMALDMSLQHLFGTTANSQLAGIKGKAVETAAARDKQYRTQDMTYVEAYEVIRSWLSLRSKLGSWYWVADSPKYRKACRVLNAFAEQIIVDAIARSKTEDGADAKSKRFSLVDNLVQEYNSIAEIREVVMDVFMAGQNMTGTIAAWLFAELEKHPEVWHEIRREVLDLFGTESQPKEPMTWDNLRLCQTLQFAIYETLRKYPALPNISRNALCDTVLPRGGGPDGSQPIVVPKGIPVTCCLYLMHRREEEWGADTEAFRPERWLNRKFGPEYLPFGAGARICIGQQLSMTEISYVTARMAQRFDSLVSSEGQENLVKGYAVLVQPKNGVKVRLRYASGV